MEDPLLEVFLNKKHRSHILSSKGNENSIVVCDQEKRLNKNFLMVKNQKKSDFVNRRALFAFDTKELDLARVETARISLNSVPTGLGTVGTMPAESTFQLYGIPDGQDENWQRSGFLKWADAPAIENALPLASFKVSRARLRTKVFIESKKLLNFIRSDQTAEVSFILVCTTPGGTMVHGFASSLNSEASGPQLELVMGK